MSIHGRVPSLLLPLPIPLGTPPAESALTSCLKSMYVPPQMAGVCHPKASAGVTLSVCIWFSTVRLSRPSLGGDCFAILQLLFQHLHYGLADFRTVLIKRFQLWHIQEIGQCIVGKPFSETINLNESRPTTGNLFPGWRRHSFLSLDSFARRAGPTRRSRRGASA